MTQVPVGWTDASLGQLADFIMGQAPPGADCNKSGRGTPFVKAGEFGPERPVIREWTMRPLKLAQEGDVLICVVGATSGKINLGADCAIGRSVAAIRPSDALSQRYLYEFLSTKILELRSGSVGTAQGVISKDDLANIEIPLAPLPEQRRIVAKIDSLSAKSKRARDQLDHVPALVKRYKRAILDRAFRRFRNRQKLVRLVVPDRGIPYGIIQTGKPTTGGIPTVRGGDIKGFRVSRSELKAVDPAIENNYRRTRLQGGEVLIAIRGSVGEPCVVPPDMKGCNISREVAMIPVGEGISPKFVMYYLASSEAKEFILGNTKGVAQQGINLGDLCELPTPLPTAAEQQRAVQRIEKAFNWIDRLASDATSARKLIDHLDQAVLAKAFRGELVPQGPHDEPASVLLERIKAERQIAGPPRRRNGQQKLCGKRAVQTISK
jgi:type I restriction enzyme S subunit